MMHEDVMLIRFSFSLYAFVLLDAYDASRQAYIYDFILSYSLLRLYFLIATSSEIYAIFFCETEFSCEIVENFFLS